MDKYIKNKYFLLICIIIFLIFIINITFSYAQNTNEIKDIFESKYQKWKEWKKNNSVASRFSHTKPYRDIIKLGIPAVPYIIKKMEENAIDYFLVHAVQLITKKRFGKSKWPKDRLGDSITKAKMYINWWRNERKKTPEQFEKLFKAWQTYKRNKKGKEAKRVFKQMKNLGIIAIPFIIEKIKQDELEFINMVSELTDGDIPENSNKEKCIKSWGKYKRKWMISIND